MLLQGYGVYKFQDKYGVNVDGYSPIWTPDTWSESGEQIELACGTSAAPDQLVQF